MGTPQRTEDVDLTRLALENEMELWARAVTVMDGGAAGRVDGFGWFVSGLPIAALNRVDAVGDDVGAPALTRAVALVRERGVPFQVRLRTGDDGLLPALE